MKNLFGILLAVCLLTALPASAGNLTFEGNQPVWHSAKCVRPTPPESIINADPETAGNDMNARISAYNAYARKAQDYMNCLSLEAAEDQKNVSRAIADTAQAEIASMATEAEKVAAPLRGPKK